MSVFVNTGQQYVREGTMNYDSVKPTMDGIQQNPIEYIERTFGNDEYWGFRGPGWYYWDETWTSVSGPFQTAESAEAALTRYCREVLAIDYRNN